MEKINSRTKDLLIVWMFLFMGLLISKSTMAQSQRVNKEGMEELSNWVGTWEGEGWQMDETMQKKTFKVKEVVESKLDGMAISVEGKGVGPDGNLGHHAIGLIFYDLDAKNYTFQSVTFEGYATRTEGSFNEDGQFVWGFKIPQAQLRYTITLEGDEWIERGEYSRDGEQWWPTMEMKLRRVK